MNATYAGLRVWQIGVIAAFLVVGFGGSYLAYTVLTGSDGAPSGEHEQLIPVTRGNLVNDVSINGSVGYPNRETLNFGTQGTLGQLLVEEGQDVVAGQPLAVIDAETAASLQEAVADAEVRLRDSEDALETALNPFSALEIARAESDVASASVALEDAVEDLAALIQPSKQAVAKAESAVADARESATAALETLAELLSPGDGAVAQAEIRVAKARTDLDDARESLARLESPDENEVDQAEGKVATARVALNEARESLAKLVTPDESEVDQAEAKLVGAKVALSDAREALTKLVTSDEDAVDRAEAKVVNGRVVLSDAQESLAKLLSPDEHELNQAKAKVTSAEIALSDAREKLSRLVEPDAGQIAEAEAAVAASAMALADAIEALDTLSRPDAEALAKARSAVTDARTAYDDALTALQELEGGPSADETAELQAAVELAEATLTSVELDLRLASRKWEADVASAFEDVGDAEDRYAGAFRKWLGIEIVGDQLRSEPTALLESLGLDLELIFAPKPVPYTVGLPQDDPATVWSETLVHIWLNLYPGSVVTTCPDATLSSGSLCIGRELDEAWETLSAALDALETVEANAAKALVKAESDVDKAVEDLSNAQDALAELTEPPDSLEMESARVRVELALASLETARADLARLEAPTLCRAGPQGEAGRSRQGGATAGKGRPCRAGRAKSAGRGGGAERGGAGGGRACRRAVAVGGAGDAGLPGRGGGAERRCGGGGGACRRGVALG